MKRALLVGIEDYLSLTRLNGCVADVTDVAARLASNAEGSPNFFCQSLTGDKSLVDREALVSVLERLLAPGADVALFYFAGHGVARGNDVVLCVADGTDRNPGLNFSELLGLVQRSAVREVLIMLDCCFSGAGGSVPQLGSAASVLRPGLSILAASRGDQAAVEASGRGAFSALLCEALDGGAADVLGKVTLSGVYAYLSEAFGPWDQRPTFKTNVDQLHVLRSCTPAVPLAELRQLPKLFADSSSELALDPSYEETLEPRNSANEAIFKVLQHCRSAKLIEPVGTDHLFYAALESRTCRLTALGKHYWRMAKQGRL